MEIEAPSIEVFCQCNKRGERNAPPSCSVSLFHYIDSEVLPLKLKKLIYYMKPPCSKCLYKLGLVHTVVNPCPQCKENGYSMFEQFQCMHRGPVFTFQHKVTDDKQE